MPGYAPIHPVVGGGPLTELMTPDTTQRFPLGMVLDAIDPYFGYGRFVYLQSAGAINPGRLVQLTDQTFVVADLANVGNLAVPFYVARQVFGATGEFGWFQMEGVAPIQVNASVAAGAAIGIGAAGQGGTNTAGHQLCGVRVLQPSTFTLTKTAQTTNGATQLGVQNINGLFVGLTVSGTGIPGSTTVSALDPSGRFLTMSAAATATGTITATFTYTGFVLLQLNSPQTQGAIT